MGRGGGGMGSRRVQSSGPQGQGDLGMDALVQLHEGQHKMAAWVQPWNARSRALPGTRAAIKHGFEVSVGWAE